MIVLLLAVMALAACGGSGGSAATAEPGAAENVPASDAAVTAAETTTETMTETVTAAATEAAATADIASSDVQTAPVSSASETSGAGDTSGANSTGEAAAAADVGSGSDGAAGSGGSNEAGGATAPDSDTGAPVASDNTGNTESGTGSAPSGAAAYTAVTDAECTEIQGQLTAALGVEVSRTTGVTQFSDLNGGTGESCRLTASGTGVNFTSMPATAALISQLFTDNGWTADNQYVADGPTGTIGGLRRDNQLAAYNVDWSPAEGVTCPSDQPISACAETLTPEQMAYTITVDLAQQ
jgi:hypothetical protein